jgi:hypothetical protein
MIMTVVYWIVADRFEHALPDSWYNVYGYPLDCNECVWLVPGTFE